MFQKYFVEEVCLKKLHYLYSLSREQILHYLTDERKTEADQKYYLVRRYIKEHIKSKGKQTFEYYHNRADNRGRLFCGSSVQNIPKKFRGFLFNDCIDIDMKNCAPTIFLYLAKKFGFIAPNLQYYCDHCDEMRANDDGLKKSVIRILNYHKIQKYGNNFKNNLNKEIFQIQKHLLSLDEYAWCRDEVNADYNIEGKIINNILCYHENEILQFMMKTLTEKDATIVAPFFDGCLVKGDVDVASLQRDVDLRFPDLNMKIHIKPHDTNITMPEDYEIPRDIPQEDDYEEQKKRWEERYAFCTNNGEIIDLQDNNIKFVKERQLKNFIHYYRVDKHFIKRWLEDANIRSYTDIVFDPSCKSAGTLNRFVGFKYECFDQVHVPDDFEDTNLFLQLCRHHCQQKEVYEYFLSWMAHIIQKPYIKTNTAIILYSETKGSGKNALVEGFSKLLDGYVGEFASIDDINKQFNSHLANKLLICGDEITARAKNVHDKLKSFITQKTQLIEMKGFEAYSINDYSNLIFTTNNEGAFKYEDGDRRFLMIHVQEKRLNDANLGFDSTDLFESYEDEECLRQLYYFLKNYKMKYNIGKDLPVKTSYALEQRYENIEGFKHMFYMMDPETFCGVDYSSTELYKMAKEWSQKNHKSAAFSVTKMGIYCTEIFGSIKTRTKTGNLYKFSSFKDVGAYLKYLYMVDKPMYRYFMNLAPDEEVTFVAKKSKSSESKSKVSDLDI